MVWRHACGFFQNPEIIFFHFLHILNLDIFWVLILHVKYCFLEKQEKCFKMSSAEKVTQGTKR